MKRLVKDAFSGGRRRLLDLAQVVVASYVLVDQVRPGGRLGLAVAQRIGDAIGATGVLAALVWLILAATSLAGLRSIAMRRRVALGLALVGLPPALSFVGAMAGGSLGMAGLHGLRHWLGVSGSVPVLAGWWAFTLYFGLQGTGVRKLGRPAKAVVSAIATASQAVFDFVAPEMDPSEPAKSARKKRPRTSSKLPAVPSQPTTEQPLLPDSTPASPEVAATVAPAPVSIAERARSAPVPSRAEAAGDYQVPPISLLERGSTRLAAASEAAGRRKVLEDTLQSFGVRVHVTDAVQGPVVTRFELQPAPGIKVSRILSLQDDLALALAAPRVRIEAPVPGRSVVGIEVPNLEVSTVRLRDVLESPGYQREASPLAVALGKDVAGAPVVAALDRMPHLLIAGATGSGKSVCINAIITSLLFRSAPSRVRLLLIDPKVVELGQYDGIPHLLAPVVTDPREAYGALAWVVREMEGRYRKFAERGARDVVRYNAVLEPGDKPLPYLVVVIDELADLMMVASTKVEEAIARLAQMARAAGIHLVVATQRPSVDVITGLIKANIPSRLAFAVSSQVDSRTILDTGGAEKLLGRGDMLFSPMGAAKPIRAQGALVTEGEVEALIAYVREQATPTYEEEVIQSAQAAATEEEMPDEDALFADALRVVIDARQASASLLQRRLRVGYSRAARLVDAMADRGYVGPPDGARPRQVRLTMAEYGRLFADRRLTSQTDGDLPSHTGSDRSSLERTQKLNDSSKDEETDRA